MFEIKYDIIVSILVLFNIERITENIVTKPPIIKMLLIALTIAEPSIPPRSAIFMSSWSKVLKLLDEADCVLFAVNLFVVNLFIADLILDIIPRIIPTQIEDKTWEIKSNIPIEVLE